MERDTQPPPMLTAEDRRRRITEGLDARSQAMTSQRPGHRDEWMRGYAAALGAVRRLFREDKIVEQVLIGDGLTLAQLVEAGAESFDTEAIAKALTGSTKAAKQARGGR